MCPQSNTSPKPETTLRQLIIEWTDEALGKGGEHNEAFAVAAERIVKEGHSDTFVREFAVTTVREVYQDRIRKDRKAALTGQRRHDPELLKGDDSLMDTLWHVGGQTIRLGDFDKVTCQAAKGEFAVKARGLIQDVNFLEQIQQKLKLDQTVTTVFTDDQLRSLWESSRVMD
jgi:hypothetical protein